MHSRAAGPGARARVHVSSATAGRTMHTRLATATWTATVLMTLS